MFCKLLSSPQIPSLRALTEVFPCQEREGNCWLSLDAHRTILQCPKVQGTTGKWMSQRSQALQRWCMLLSQPYPLCAWHMQGSGVPSKLMRSCPSLGSLWPLQLQRPLQMLETSEILDTLISVPDPSGWIISLVDLEPHSLQAYLCHSAPVTIVTRHLLPGPARNLPSRYSSCPHLSHRQGIPALNKYLLLSSMC